MDAVADELETLTAGSGDTPERTLRRALLALLSIGRSRPHLHRLMFTVPAADPAAVARAPERAQGHFLDLVTAVVGAAAARQYAALLLTSVHGATGLELSGHLSPAKWGTTPEDLLDLLIGVLPRPS
ncbi:WHG domain-containing protein [Umezawaea sp.]|uniref:WHG domain-containing protein n=1 Tax=Umezawaea sp. TaxID=1955258 RepID=UPI002ED289B2